MKKKSQKKSLSVNFFIATIIFFLGILVGGLIFSRNFFLNKSVEAKGEQYYSNLVAYLKADTATFDFDYSGTVPYKDKALYYIVDVSTGGKFSNQEWKNQEWINLALSGSTPESPDAIVPIVVYDPQSKWSKYICGATIYWRIRAVVRTGVINTSPVQQSVIDCSAS